jgi:hypothetical protein
MKEYTEAFESSFIDFFGKEHRFVIGAVSQILPKYTEQGEELTYEVNEFLGDENGVNDCLGTVVKILRIGFSVCNPEDKFDFEVGKLKAISRARMNTPILYATTPGVINTKVVKALLQQEAEYLKKNPELLIPGYLDKIKRYKYNCKMQELKKSFSPLENEVLRILQVNSKALDNVLQYTKWKQNQEKGNNKCLDEN